MAVTRYSRMWIVAMVALFLVAVIGPCRFSSARVCRTCGIIEYRNERQLPLTRLTYWTSRSTNETRLSRMLNERGLVGGHEHDWVFAAGGGNGIACAIGPARDWHCDSPTVVSFLTDVAKYDGKQAALFAKERLLDKSEEDPLMSAVFLVDYPEKGAVDKQDYLEKVTYLRRELKRRDSDFILPLASKAEGPPQRLELPQ